MNNILDLYDKTKKIKFDLKEFFSGKIKKEKIYPLKVTMQKK